MSTSVRSSSVLYGFASLIGFDKSENQMQYQDFLSRYLLDYVATIVYCFGLAVCGLNSAELAAKLFRVARFRSAGVFSLVKMNPMGDSSAEELAFADMERTSASGRSWTEWEEQFLSVGKGL